VKLFSIIPALHVSMVSVNTSNMIWMSFCRSILVCNPYGTTDQINIEIDEVLPQLKRSLDVCFVPLCLVSSEIVSCCALINKGIRRQFRECSQVTFCRNILYASASFSRDQTALLRGHRIRFLVFCWQMRQCFFALTSTFLHRSLKHTKYFSEMHGQYFPSRVFICFP